MFKVGEKVAPNPTKPSYELSQGMVGVVVGVYDDLPYPYRVKWDHGDTPVYDESELISYKNQTILNRCLKK